MTFPFLQRHPSQRPRHYGLAGDAKAWQVRTEVSLLVRDEKPLYAIRDCTTSGA